MRRGNSRERGERHRAGSQLQKSAAWKYHGAFLQISVALPVTFPPADRLGAAAVLSPGRGSTEADVRVGSKRGQLRRKWRCAPNSDRKRARLLGHFAHNLSSVSSAESISRASFEFGSMSSSLATSATYSGPSFVTIPSIRLFSSSIIFISFFCSALSISLPSLPISQ